MSLLDNLNITKQELDAVDVSPQELWDQYSVRADVKVDKPPVCVSIGQDYSYQPSVPYLLYTYGNISLMLGQEKVGKSFAKSLILAGALGGKANFYTERIKGHNLEGKFVIELDTEQDKFYTQWNRKRVVSMVGNEPVNYITQSWRALSTDSKLIQLDWLFTQSPYKDKLGLVFIDGYVDLVKDFNSLTESREFVEKLMIYSEKANCHISGILHLNPGSEKGRGHLGTVLQQKCETVIQVVKEEGYVTLKPMRTRGKSWDELNFEIKNGLPKEKDVLNSMDEGFI